MAAVNHGVEHRGKGCCVSGALQQGDVADVVHQGRVRMAVRQHQVLHDELDIDFGAVRLKRGGGEGGHNGLRSLSQALGTRDYLRVRIGIGRPPGRQDPADFVLKPFPSSARSEVELLIANGCDAVELLLGQDLESAQNTVHAW